MGREGVTQGTEKAPESEKIRSDSAKSGAEAAENTGSASNVSQLDPFGDVGAAVLASLLGLTATRVQQLAREGVIPRAARGKYPVRSGVRGYVEFLRRSSAGPENVDPEKLEPFKQRVVEDIRDADED